MAKPPVESSNNEHTKDGVQAPEKPICGVIMPIGTDSDYSEEHWRRVQRIIIRAIERSDMRARLVWENPEIDVIHTKILQNIYDSDVVVCDVSSLNPNVMLELGLRLSTKRPTVVITDTVKKPPFDITAYQYFPYQRDLEYNAVDKFIGDLSDKIRQVHQSYLEGKYKSFVENFTFEVVELKEVSVSAEEALRERIEGVARQISRLDARLAGRERAQPKPLLLSFEGSFTKSGIEACGAELRSHPAILRVEFKEQGFTTHLDVVVDGNLPAAKLKDLQIWIKDVADKHEELPF